MTTTPSPTEYGEALKAWRARLATWAGLDLATTATVDVIDGRPTNDLTRVVWTAHSRVQPTAARGTAAPPEVWGGVGNLPEWRCSIHLMPGEESQMWAEVGPKPAIPPAGVTWPIRGNRP